MAMVAEKYDYVIGIDTHARIHTYSIVNTKLVPAQAANHSPYLGLAWAEPSP